MSNRKDLLDGARSCLLEKGYARTTARDIAGAAGVSLAAIGYHFGTKDALLSEALQQALREWGDNMEQLLITSSEVDDPADRFETAWDVVVGSFADDRSLWAVQFELLMHINNDAHLRRTFGEANRAAQQGLVNLFGLPTHNGPTKELGVYLQMLIAGAAAQWLVDPDSILTGAQMRQTVVAMSAMP